MTAHPSRLSPGPSRSGRPPEAELYQLRTHIGIIVMDYFEEPRELVSNVIKANVTTRATGTPGR